MCNIYVPPCLYAFACSFVLRFRPICIVCSHGCFLCKRRGCSGQSCVVVLWCVLFAAVLVVLLTCLLVAVVFVILPLSDVKLHAALGCHGFVSFWCLWFYVCFEVFVRI